MIAGLVRRKQSGQGVKAAGTGVDAMPREYDDAAAAAWGSATPRRGKRPRVTPNRGRLKRCAMTVACADCR